MPQWRKTISFPSDFPNELQSLLEKETPISLEELHANFLNQLFVLNDGVPWIVAQAHAAQKDPKELAKEYLEVLHAHYLEQNLTDDELKTSLGNKLNIINFLDSLISLKNAPAHIYQFIQQLILVYSEQNSFPAEEFFTLYKNIYPPETVQSLEEEADLEESYKERALQIFIEIEPYLTNILAAIPQDKEEQFDDILFGYVKNRILHAESNLTFNRIRDEVLTLSNLRVIYASSKVSSYQHSKETPTQDTRYFNLAISKDNSTTHQVQKLFFPISQDEYAKFFEIFHAQVSTEAIRVHEDDQLGIEGLKNDYERLSLPYADWILSQIQILIPFIENLPVKDRKFLAIEDKIKKEEYKLDIFTSYFCEYGMLIGDLLDVYIKQHYPEGYSLLSIYSNSFPNTILEKLKDLYFYSDKKQLLSRLLATKNNVLLKETSESLTAVQLFQKMQNDYWKKNKNIPYLYGLMILESLDYSCDLYDDFNKTRTNDNVSEIFGAITTLKNLYEFLYVEVKGEFKIDRFAKDNLNFPAEKMSDFYNDVIPRLRRVLARDALKKHHPELQSETIKAAIETAEKEFNAKYKKEDENERDQLLAEIAKIAALAGFKIIESFHNPGTYGVDVLSNSGHPQAEAIRNLIEESVELIVGEQNGLYKKSRINSDDSTVRYRVSVQEKQELYKKIVNIFDAYEKDFSGDILITYTTLLKYSLFLDELEKQLASKIAVRKRAFAGIRKDDNDTKNDLQKCLPLTKTSWQHLENIDFDKIPTDIVEIVDLKSKSRQLLKLIPNELKEWWLQQEIVLYDFLYQQYYTNASESNIQYLMRITGQNELTIRNNFIDFFKQCVIYTISRKLKSDTTRIKKITEMMALLAEGTARKINDNIGAENLEDIKRINNLIHDYGKESITDEAKNTNRPPVLPDFFNHVFEDVIDCYKTTQSSETLSHRLLTQFEKDILYRKIKSKINAPSSKLESQDNFLDRLSHVLQTSTTKTEESLLTSPYEIQNLNPTTIGEIQTYLSQIIKGAKKTSRPFDIDNTTLKPIYFTFCNEDLPRKMDFPNEEVLFLYFMKLDESVKKARASIRDAAMEAWWDSTIIPRISEVLFTAPDDNQQLGIYQFINALKENDPNLPLSYYALENIANAYIAAAIRPLIKVFTAQAYNNYVAIEGEDDSIKEAYEEYYSDLLTKFYERTKNAIKATMHKDSIDRQKTNWEKLLSSSESVLKQTINKELETFWNINQSAPAIKEIELLEKLSQESILIFLGEDSRNLLKGATVDSLYEWFYTITKDKFNIEILTETFLSNFGYPTSLDFHAEVQIPLRKMLLKKFFPEESQLIDQKDLEITQQHIKSNEEKKENVLAIVDSFHQHGNDLVNKSKEETDQEQSEKMFFKGDLVVKISYSMTQTLNRHLSSNVPISPAGGKELAQTIVEGVNDKVKENLATFRTNSGWFYAQIKDLLEKITSIFTVKPQPSPAPSTAGIQKTVAYSCALYNQTISRIQAVLKPPSRSLVPS